MELVDGEPSTDTPSYLHIASCNYKMQFCLSARLWASKRHVIYDYKI